MKTVKLTCVECPIGCQMEVEVDDETVKEVRGNSCPRGKKYAETEVVAPRRIVTSTVRTTGEKVVPVKTDKGVLKQEIFAVMERINQVEIALPVTVGEVLLEGIADGVNLVATASMKE